jgi:threonine dehydrogenase-like Zn-dependent dehydrogenase
VKAIVNTDANRLEWLDVPRPDPDRGQVRIRTAAVGICATDVEMIAGWERTGFPSIPGHEWSGVVDAVGSCGNPDFVGRPCVAENVWSDGGEVGFEHPGGYGQFFVTEQANVHLLPDEFPMSSAALIEPLAVCVHARNRARANLVEPVMIMGDGPIGLLMLAVLRNMGISDITLVGGRDYRLAVGREMGARRTCEHQGIASGASGLGDFRTIVEASGSTDALNAAMNLAMRGATILLLGDYGTSRAGFLWNTILHRELHLIGSNASAGAWPEAVMLAVSGQIPLDRLATHRMPADQFSEGLRLTRDRQANMIKVILDWEQFCP